VLRAQAAGRSCGCPPLLPLTAGVRMCYILFMLILPLEPARAETTVINSRFIASLAPVESIEAARNFIASIRAEFPDATHHVPAYIVGGGASSTEYCSDDGEPSGTSGRPLLAVLKGSGMGDIAIVVTRYFGGTLLGTGGLVRAYSGAGKAVLAVTKKARLVESGRFEFELPYQLYDRFLVMARELGALPVKKEFAEDVSLAVELPLAARSDFEKRLAALSSGAARPELKEEFLRRSPL